MMKYCRKCLLPASAPDARLDPEGVCGFCRGEALDVHVIEPAKRARLRADLNQTLSAIPRLGPYDALVCLSGGKDSLYLLHKLKVEHGLRVLAFTVDMSIPPVAWDNIRRTVERLDVDHVIHRPPLQFYKKLYRFLLTNQEARGAVRSVSYVYAPLFESAALRAATEMRIPLIFAGYSPGQPDPRRMTYEFSRDYVCNTDWTPEELRDCGLFDEDELARFWNPKRYPAGTSFPRYIAPFHAWDYDQDEIMREVVRLGLAASRRHASPIHSNFLLNWLLMYSDLVHFGYNPYAPEFAALIRHGKASRWRWRVLQPLVNFMISRKVLLGRHVSKSLRWLELTTEDLRIVRPAKEEPVTSRF